MKSLAIGLAGDIWYWLVLILFWGAAFLLFRLSMRRWRTSKRWAALTLGALALWCALVPHWHTFPGWAIAQAVCRDVGGIKAYQPVPVVSAGLLVRGHQFGENDLARTLLREGFEFVEDIPHRNNHRSWGIPGQRSARYRIGKLAHPECAQFEALRSRDPETINMLYLHGMKDDECLVVEPFETPTAKVALRHYEEFKFFPTPIVYSLNDVVWTASGEQIAALRGFHYFSSDPRRNGRPEIIDCHDGAARSGSNSNRGWVVGPSSRLPEHIVLVNGSSPSPVTAPLNFRVDISDKVVTASQRVDFFKAAIGLGQPDSELWSIADEERSLLAVVRSGTEPVAYSIPSLDRELVAPESLDHQWEYARLGKVLGYRNIEGNLVLVRSYGGIWEVGELNTETSEWRRSYVRVLDAFREARAYDSSSLPVILRRLQVNDDSIELEAAILASEYVVHDAKVRATIAFTVQRTSGSPRIDARLPLENEP